MISKIKLYKRGDIVTGIDTTFPRSQYEVLADDGFMLLLIQRELNGFINPRKTDVCIRPRDFFQLRNDPTVQKSEDIELILPENWYINYDQIILKHNNKVVTVKDIYFG